MQTQQKSLSLVLLMTGNQDNVTMMQASKRQNRYKQNKTLEQILSQKQKGWVSQDECTDIVNYIYNKRDAQFLLAKLEDLYTYRDLDDLER